MEWSVNVELSGDDVWYYLVNTLYFRNIGDCVGSVFILVGFDLSLENKKTKSGEIKHKMLAFAELCVAE